MNRHTRTVALLPNHPSQVWLLEPVARRVEQFADVVWVLRDKDCAVDVADALGLDYTVISEASSGLWGNAREFWSCTRAAIRLAKEKEVDLWVTKYGPGNVAGLLSGGRSLSFNDDDGDVVPLIAFTSYPFSVATLVTSVTRMPWFEPKAVRLPTYYELAYLHPKRFQPRGTIHSELGLSPKDPYAIIRLSALRAHHDRGVTGVTSELVEQVDKLVNGRIRLFISSEDPLLPEFEQYRCNLPVERMHEALAGAEFFLGDSQTMTSEAAVLGTPAFRLNDFVGRISYIEDLENRGLAFGFKPGNEGALLTTLRDVIHMEDRQKMFQRRRQRMLDETVDPVPCFVRAIRAALNGAACSRIRRQVLRECDGFTT